MTSYKPLTPTVFHACLLLSSLLLDTTLTAAQELHLSRELHNLNIPLPEILTLFRNDVFPACYHNLYEVAGEWAGFDSAWLEARIRQNRGLKGSWLWRWRRGDRHLKAAWQEFGKRLKEDVERIWRLQVAEREGSGDENQIDDSAEEDIAYQCASRSTSTWCLL